MGSDSNCFKRLRLAATGSEPEGLSTHKPNPILFLAKDHPSVGSIGFVRDKREGDRGVLRFLLLGGDVKPIRPVGALRRLTSEWLLQGIGSRFCLLLLVASVWGFL